MLLMTIGARRLCCRRFSLLAVCPSVNWGILAAHFLSTPDASNLECVSTALQSCAVRPPQG